MLPYIALDIETTGLEPSESDIIEIGAVFDDLVSPLEALPYIHLICRNQNDQYLGGAYALSMHTRLFRILSERDPVPDTARMEDIHICLGALRMWMADRMEGRARLAGKNLAGFDIPHLREAYSREGVKPFAYKHRVLDTGVLWFDPQADDWIPDSLECLKRTANETPEAFPLTLGAELQWEVAPDVAHTALEDAFDVVRCVRAKTGHVAHTYGEAKCAKCAHEWVAVRPLAVTDSRLECPSCGRMSGSDGEPMVRPMVTTGRIKTGE